jgi:hypothetical protein
MLGHVCSRTEMSTKFLSEKLKERKKELGTCSQCSLNPLFIGNMLLVTQCYVVRGDI